MFTLTFKLSHNFMSIALALFITVFYNWPAQEAQVITDQDIYNIIISIQYLQLGHFSRKLVAVISLQSIALEPINLGPDMFSTVRKLQVVDIYCSVQLTHSLHILLLFYCYFHDNHCMFSSITFFLVALFASERCNISTAHMFFFFSSFFPLPSHQIAYPKMAMWL